MTISTTENTKNTNSTKTTEKHEQTFLSLRQIARILEQDYGLHIAFSTLLGYVHEGVIKPDYVLKGKFLFHRDRVPEIINILKNEFREKRLKQSSQNNTNKEDNKNSSSYDSSSRTKKAGSYLASILKHLKKAD